MRFGGGAGRLWLAEMVAAGRVNLPAGGGCYIAIWESGASAVPQPWFNIQHPTSNTQHPIITRTSWCNYLRRLAGNDMLGD